MLQCLDFTLDTIEFQDTLYLHSDFWVVTAVAYRLISLAGSDSIFPARDCARAHFYRLDLPYSVDSVNFFDLDCGFSGELASGIPIYSGFATGCYTGIIF